MKIKSIAVVLIVTLTAVTAGVVLLINNLPKNETTNSVDNNNSVEEEPKSEIITNNESSVISDQNTKDSVQKDETADWEIYKNEKYGFEIKYPVGFSASRFSEDGFELSNGDEENFSNPQQNITIRAKKWTQIPGITDTPDVFREECIGKINKKEVLIIFKNSFTNRNGINFYYYANYPENIKSYCGTPVGCIYHDFYSTFSNNICYQVWLIRNESAYLLDKNQAVSDFDRIISTFEFIK